MLLPVLQLSVFPVFHHLGGAICPEQLLDVEHGLPNVLPEAVRVLRAQKGNREVPSGDGEEEKTRCINNGTSGLSRSYRVRAGELAGDVECDQIFSNNYVGHSVAVVGHLETGKTTVKLSKTATKRADVVIYSLDRILRRLPRI